MFRCLSCGKHSVFGKKNAAESLACVTPHYTTHSSGEANKTYPGWPLASARFAEEGSGFLRSAQVRTYDDRA